MEYRVISTKVHGVLDYVMGAGLMAMPLFLNTDSKAAKIIPTILGSSTLVYSLFTDYELSVSRKIPMKVHLGIDAASGLFLAASPWLLKFSKNTYLGHLIMGVMELGAVLLSQSTPSREKKALISDFVLHNKWFGTKKVHPAKVRPKKLAVA